MNSHAAYRNQFNLPFYQPTYPGSNDFYFSRRHDVTCDTKLTLVDYNACMK